MTGPHTADGVGMSRADRDGSTEAPRTAPAPSGATLAVVAVDTGGTFTDLVASLDGHIETLKVPSTPDDPARAILEGVSRLVAPGRPFVLAHGSTVATNALLERKGARVVLLTNEGFTDVLEIGRQNRPQLYAVTSHRPPRLVSSDVRWGLKGRLGPDGTELEPLDRDELSGLARRLEEAEADAVAICLLHAYADPAHEQAVADVLRHTTQLPISVSSQLLPEYREYERTSTTVINAYVAPVMERYLSRLEQSSGAARIAIMASNGGTLPVRQAIAEPAQTVLSGPAGGVVGALAWARRAGFEDIVTFDMGGTSTDVAFCPGRPQYTREFEIDGHPVALPVIDIHTVGAGGGSIARVDPGGALRVGPESAGATPGPISYGLGGRDVTVTDAHVWLGRLPVDAFFAERGGLDRGQIEAPLQALASAIGLSLDATAEGVLAVADTAMERALRVISVERGHDPAQLALVAFGGAGALHAAELAQRLGMPRVLVPPSPGLLSAWGILTAPEVREAARSLLAPGDHAETAERVRAALDDLAASVRQALIDEGASPEVIDTRCFVDVRYRGQSFEIRVPAGVGDDWAEHFHAAHAQRYGYRRDDAVIEVVTCRAVATGPGREAASPTPPAAGSSLRSTRSSVVFSGQVVEAERVARRDVPLDHEIQGPALILDDSATIWLPPGWTGHVDPHAILHLKNGSASN